MPTFRISRAFDTWPAYIALFLISTTYAQTENLTAGVHVYNHRTSLGNMTFATEPRGRGTWSIIFSCTTTFVFCVWTAVHPDTIPGLKEGHRIFYRAMLMFIAVINPEAFAVLAYRQWRDAREIRDEWNKYFIRKFRPPNDKHYKPPYLSMGAAFFVVMGGFVIDKSDAKSNEYSKTKHIETLERYNLVDNKRAECEFTATLTRKGFAKYLKEGYFDDFKERFDTKEIMDKSKASYFGKALASLQALWLLVQSLQRYRSGLTIT